MMDSYNEGEQLSLPLMTRRAESVIADAGAVVIHQRRANAYKLSAELSDAELLTAVLGPASALSCEWLTTKHDGFRAIAVLTPADLLEHGFTTGAVSRLSAVLEIAKRYGQHEFHIMGLIGVIGASIVGMFWHNSALQFVIACVGVLVFTGLTAWDAQRLKQMAVSLPDGQVQIAARGRAVAELRTSSSHRQPGNGAADMVATYRSGRRTQRDGLALSFLQVCGDDQEVIGEHGGGDE